MDRIKLSKEEKDILLLIKDRNSTTSVGLNQVCLISLEQNKLITVYKDDSGEFMSISLTGKGKIYLLKNPQLTNPSIWDDKKYWINTAISVMAVVISAIALYFSICK